ncbi:MAG: hypothetical protein B7C24_17020 [Bacteroidetes bacterium 4572_77]|nr:MAG: hypothetical protein B7C24_17020 [Bacteroidetes bacterium 4572_77]
MMRKIISMDNKDNTLKRIFQLGKPFWGWFLLVLVLNTLFSTLQALAIALMNPVLKLLFTPEEVVASEPTLPSENFLNRAYEAFNSNVFEYIQSPEGVLATLMNLGVLLMIIFIAKNMFKYCSALAGVKLQQGLVKSIRDKTFEKLTALSMRFYKKNNEGELISIMTNDAVSLNQNTIMVITIIMRDSIQILFFLLICLSISVKLLLISLIAISLAMVIISISRKSIKKYSGRMQQSMADYTSTMQETIAGIRIIKAFNGEEFINKKFQKDSKKYVTSALKTRVITGFVPAISEVISIFALCVVMYIGGSDVISGKMMPADLLTFLFAIFAIMSPGNIVINNIARFQTGLVSAERLFRILDNDSTMPSGDKSVDKFEKDIKLKDLKFQYEDDHTVLNNISIDILKNKQTAFVGPSGSGKSTVLDMIIRYYDPNAGAIELDGTDIRSFDTKKYRDLFGIVSQETILFNDTITNNIRYGKDTISDEEVIEATKKANAYDFIMAMPNGFDTVIGNRGTNISGGERQRLAIARALVKNPEILIFDEATSALDTKSEQVVQNAIESSLSNKTAIIVAHRLSTIKNCDNIIVFDHGQVIEQGTHQELLEKDGLYKRLCDIQSV